MMNVDPDASYGGRDEDAMARLRAANAEMAAAAASKRVQREQESRAFEDPSSTLPEEAIDTSSLATTEVDQTTDQ